MRQHQDTALREELTHFPRRTGIQCVSRAMHIYYLRSEMVVARSITDTFEFFKNPGNLSKITPGWLNFQVRTKNVEMRKGAAIDYGIRWLGMPMHWRSIISEYEAPHYFVDVQDKGPYALWRHRHTFERVAAGTLIVDRVEYALPLGALGRIANAVLVKHQLEAVFRYRHNALSAIFKGQIVSAKEAVFS